MEPVEKIEIEKTSLGIKKLARIMVPSGGKVVLPAGLNHLRVPAVLMNLNLMRWSVQKEGYDYIYISNKEYLTRKGHDLESQEITARKISEAGRLFGYPECCIKTYVKDVIKHKKVPTPVDVYKKSDKHSHLLNNLHMKCGTCGYFSLISHIPCSYNCESSKKIAVESMEISRRLFSDHENKMRSLQGKFLYKDYHLIIGGSTAKKGYDFFKFTKV